MQDDSLIIRRMSELLPETHTLALVFRDIAALYNAGEDERRYLLNLRTLLPKVINHVRHNVLWCQLSTYALRLFRWRRF